MWFSLFKQTKVASGIQNANIMQHKNDLSSKAEKNE